MPGETDIARAEAQARAELAAESRDAKLADIAPAPRRFRPVGLGLYRLCDILGVSLDGNAETSADIVALCYLVAAPGDNAALVALAHRGREAFQQAADTWAFDQTAEEMDAIKAHINAQAPAREAEAGGTDKSR